MKRIILNVREWQSTNIPLLTQYIPLLEHRTLVESFANDKNHRASEDAARFFSLPSLTRQWAMPYGETHENAWKMILLLSWMLHDGLIYAREINALYNAFTKLNPDITTIPHRTTEQKTDAIMGMVSGFNYDDIHDFIVIGGGHMRDDAYHAKRELADQLFPLYYIPSDKSLDKILSLDKNSVPVYGPRVKHVRGVALTKEEEKAYRKQLRKQKTSPV